MKYWSEVERLAIETKIVLGSWEIQPCTAAEVRELEKAVGLQLPEVYKEFLLWAGRGLGSFMTGSRFYYEQTFNLTYTGHDGVYTLTEVCNEMLEENDSPDRLPEDAFVFWSHGGYMFSFFRTSEGENPPIHNYREGENDNRIRWNYEESFVSFVRDEMNYQAGCYAEAQETEERIQRNWKSASD